MPTSPQVTKDSSAEILANAYPTSISWDNDENSFLAELPAFNNTQLHAASWAEVASAARIAHVLLINAYRANGYVLPEVG